MAPRVCVPGKWRADNRSSVKPPSGAAETTQQQRCSRFLRPGCRKYPEPLATFDPISIEVGVIHGKDGRQPLASRQVHNGCIGEIHRAMPTARHEGSLPRSTEAVGAAEMHPRTHAVPAIRPVQQGHDRAGVDQGFSAHDAADNPVRPARWSPSAARYRSLRCPATSPGRTQSDRRRVKPRLPSPAPESFASPPSAPLAAGRGGQCPLPAAESVHKVDGRMDARKGGGHETHSLTCVALLLGCGPGAIHDGRGT